MTKEEIQAQIDLINTIQDEEEGLELDEYIYSLEYKYAKAKSIQDLQREAFEAGRKFTSYSMGCPNTYVYEIFEDYLKDLENDNRN